MMIPAPARPTPATPVIRSKTAPQADGRMSDRKFTWSAFHRASMQIPNMKYKMKRGEKKKFSKPFVSFFVEMVEWKSLCINLFEDGAVLLKSKAIDQNSRMKGQLDLSVDAQFFL